MPADGQAVGIGPGEIEGGQVKVTGEARQASLPVEPPAGSHDLVVIKYNASGTRQWTSMLGTTAGDYGRSVAVDTSGTTYMTGHTSGDLDGATNSGGNDGFIVKYDTGGTLQ